MPLTKEELLQPRYKVVSDYPYSPFEIGNILFPDSKGKELTIGYNTGFTQTIKIVTPSVADNMPHIFKRLDWWEERENNELPKYILATTEELKGDIFEVDDWAADRVGINHEWYDAILLEKVNIMPTTEQEYLDYINSHK